MALKILKRSPQEIDEFENFWILLALVRLWKFWNAVFETLTWEFLDFFGPYEMCLWKFWNVVFRNLISLKIFGPCETWLWKFWNVNLKKLMSLRIFSFREAWLWKFWNVALKNLVSLRILRETWYSRLKISKTSLPVFWRDTIDITSWKFWNFRITFPSFFVWCNIICKFCKWFRQIR